MYLIYDAQWQFAFVLVIFWIILLLHYMCIFLSPKRSQTEKIGNVQDADNFHIEQNLTDLQIMLSFLHQSYEFVLTSLIMAVNQR